MDILTKEVSEATKKNSLRRLRLNEPFQRRLFFRMF